MTLEQLDSNSFEEKIYDDCESCLVIFSRKSCHVCKSVMPVLEDFAPKYQGKIGFYQVDVEDQKALFKRFSLKSVPQVLFFKEGEYQGKLSGAFEDDQLEEQIAAII